FRDPGLTRPTLERAVNGEIRTQDAPFVVRGMLMNVDTRELAWDFVKLHWDTMDRLYPKHGMRRLAEGVTGLPTPALEADVARFFTEKKPQFGGKVLAQYLEQLHVAVMLGQREAAALHSYLSKFACAESEASYAWFVAPGPRADAHPPQHECAARRTPAHARRRLPRSSARGGVPRRVRRGRSRRSRLRHGVPGGPERV